MHLEPLLRQGHEKSAVRVAEMVYDSVAPPERKFPVIRMALSVWRSLQFFFTTYIFSPLVQDDEGLQAAKEAVLLASVPQEEGQKCVDRAFAQPGQAINFNKPPRARALVARRRGATCLPHVNFSHNFSPSQVPWWLMSWT